jgi:hypothetical protein
MDLHLFMDDEEITARYGLIRTIQPYRKDQPHPVLECDRPWEGNAVGTLSVLFDQQDRQYKMWYLVIEQRRICLALSTDGVTWTKPELDLFDHDGTATTNIVQGDRMGDVFTVEHAPAPHDPGAPGGRWPADARFIACEHLKPRDLRAGPGPGEFAHGIYAAWSPDGIHWQRHLPVVLPEQGDRTTLYWDAVGGRLMLLSRHRNRSVQSRNNVRGLKRDLGLWISQNLIDWEYHGVILRPDDLDEDDTEFYGMNIFRYGRGFVGFVQVYHRAIEKLDVELAWSSDGLRWQRIGRGQPCLSLGGEGAWDSHWVQPAHSPPQIDGERLAIWYNGGSTKHGSGDAHRKAVGAASLRRDGFVSLEAGREEGAVVTTELPSDGEKTLEVNASFPAGRLSVEVLDANGAVLPGYGADDCTVAPPGEIRTPVRWRNKPTIRTSATSIMLRFNLYQGSLFAYRWADANPAQSR